MQPSRVHAEGYRIAPFPSSHRHDAAHAIYDFQF